MNHNKGKNDVTVKLKKPLIIAGPCVAESYGLVQETCDFLIDLSLKLNFDLVFKSSFDKANRSSAQSYRGPGWEAVSGWFRDLKANAGKTSFPLKFLTDVHETFQVKEVAQVCDVLQIPAFLCRQTDLLLACVESGRDINIKKGQFMAPEAMKEIVQKARSSTHYKPIQNIYLCERGASFGYGNLVVDMRSFPIMASAAVPVIFDITHSLQLPPSSQTSTTESSGLRQFAPVLARAAAASGYVSGFFLEVHPNPKQALSDKGTQLTMVQAEMLLKQILPLLSQVNSEIDHEF